jgi:hypothetical protein
VLTHQTLLGPGLSGPADLEGTDFDTEMKRVPKRLCRIAMRGASLPWLSLCAVGALNGKCGGSATGRCCIRSLEDELDVCRLKVVGWLAGEQNTKRKVQAFRSTKPPN